MAPDQETRWNKWGKNIYILIHILGNLDWIPILKVCIFTFSNNLSSVIRTENTNAILTISSIARFIWNRSWHICFEFFNNNGHSSLVFSPHNLQVTNLVFTDLIRGTIWSSWALSFCYSACLECFFYPELRTGYWIFLSID